MSRRTAVPDRQLPQVHRVEWCWPATRRPFAHRARRLQTKFAVGSEPHELKSVVVGFSVDQYEVQPDVTVPMVLPFPRKRMVEKTTWKGLVCRQLLYDRK